MGDGISMVGGAADMTVCGLGVNANGLGGGLGGGGAVFGAVPTQPPACLWSGIGIPTHGRQGNVGMGG